MFPLLGKKEPITGPVPGAGPWAGLSAVTFVRLSFLALAGGVGWVERGTSLKGELEVGVKAVGWAESSRTPARAQSFGGCWSVYSKGLPALYICDGNLLMVPGSYKVSKAEPGPLHMKIQPGFPRGSSSIGAGPRLASAWEGPGCRSHGDAAGNLLTVPCQVGLASLGPRGGRPAGSLLPGRERVARHRIPAACVPFLALGPWRRGAEGADVVSKRVVSAGTGLPGWKKGRTIRVLDRGGGGAGLLALRFPGPRTGRDGGGGDCATLRGLAGSPPAWTQGRVEGAAYQEGPWLGRPYSLGRGGGWAGGLAGVPLCLPVGYLSGPPPCRDSLGLCLPLTGLAWEGRALPRSLQRG